MNDLFSLVLFFCLIVLAFGLFMLKISRQTMPSDTITGDWMAYIEQRIAILESKPIAASIPQQPEGLPPSALPLRVVSDTIQGILVDIDLQQWDSANNLLKTLAENHPYLPIVEFLRGRLGFAMLTAASKAPPV